MLHTAGIYKTALFETPESIARLCYRLLHQVFVRDTHVGTVWRTVSRTCTCRSGSLWSCAWRRCTLSAADNGTRSDLRRCSACTPGRITQLNRKHHLKHLPPTICCPSGSLHKSYNDAARKQSSCIKRLASVTDLELSLCDNLPLRALPLVALKLPKLSVKREYGSS